MNRSPYDMGYPNYGYEDYSRDEEEYWLSMDAEETIGEEPTDETTEPLVSKRQRDFYIDLLQGRIAQTIIESIFRKFGFEVFPYGYESYLTGIIKKLSRPTANRIVKMIRSTPDLLIYSPENHEAFLLEIKSHGAENHNFTIKRDDLEKYLAHWPDAVFVVLLTKSIEIFAVKVSNISIAGKSSFIVEGSKEAYSFNLLTEFISLQNFFELPETPYESYINSIKIMLTSKYGSQV